MLKTRFAIRPRRTYLLSAFQSRLALTFALLSGIPVLLTLFLIYRFVRGSGGASSIAGLLFSGSNNNWLAGAVLVLFSSFVVLFSVGNLMLHRIAGPVHIMTRYLSELAEGRCPEIRPLRSKDELIDLFLSLKWMVERLRRRELEESVAIQTALETLAQLRPSARHDALVATLQRMLERKLAFGEAAKAHGEARRTLAEAPASPRNAGEPALTKVTEE